VISQIAESLNPATHISAKEPLMIPLFLKWAGGKLQLLKQFEKLFPAKLCNYYEPFVGSGAVFFYVKSKLKPNKVILSDANEELINCFAVVRDKPSELVETLFNYRKKHSREQYYKVRSLEPDGLDAVNRAARLVYLNKTCFNGLYRVNSKGQFNVPFGDYENPSIFNANTLFQASQLLQGVQLHVMSFEKVIDFAGKDDFVYFDPPYIPLSKTSNFTQYSRSHFSMREQKLLSEVFKILDTRGCLVMLSNSDHSLTRELYRNYEKNIVIVRAKRKINSIGSKRGAIAEVVLTNYRTANHGSTIFFSQVSNLSSN
jgi:DNA adenine methylase